MVVKSNDVLRRELLPGAMQSHIWDKNTGAGSVSMGVITLQPGVALKPHRHLVEDAMVVISGTGSFVVDDLVTPIAAGDGLLAPAGTTHFIRNDGSEPLVIVYTWPSVQVERFS